MSRYTSRGSTCGRWHSSPQMCHPRNGMAGNCHGAIHQPSPSHHTTHNIAIDKMRALSSPNLLCFALSISSAGDHPHASNSVHATNLCACPSFVCRRWLHPVLTVTTEDILIAAGFDAVVTLKIIEFGVQLFGPIAIVCLIIRAPLVPFAMCTDVYVCHGAR